MSMLVLTGSSPMVSVYVPAGRVTVSVGSVASPSAAVRASLREQGEAVTQPPATVWSFVVLTSNVFACAIVGATSATRSVAHAHDSSLLLNCPFPCPWADVDCYASASTPTPLGRCGKRVRVRAATAAAPLRW